VAEETPAYKTSPDDHRVKLAPMNPRSGSNQEIGRHTDVVGILPNEAVVIRLVGAVLTKQHDEW
jgi:transposase-like protein